MARIPTGSADATRHTAIINSPLKMWEKLGWDADVFQDTQRKMPKEDQPLAYAAINVAIAAASLKDWTGAQWVTSGRAQGQKRTETDFQVLAYDRVPSQPMCDAIANTSKHSRFSERSWGGGAVQLVWTDGDENWPSGYELIFVEGMEKHQAYGLFDRIVSDWWNFLCELGMASGEQPLPAWYQNKLERIFGKVSRALANRG